MGHQLARLLVASGLGTLYVYDNEPPDLVLVSRSGRIGFSIGGAAFGPRRRRTRQFRRSATGPSQKRRWISRSLPVTNPELDRVITDHLVRNDQPHLVVRCWGKG